jgi:nicotinamide riboside kinase
MKGKGKLIQIIGPPSSGKSTLASQVNGDMKENGLNTVFISEVATDYISEYGVPNEPIDQLTIFYKQANKELMFKNSKDYIICDSSSILNYIYFRKLFTKKLKDKDIANINHLQKEILKQINNIDYIFYVPPILTSNTSDGIRYHNNDEIILLGTLVKSYLDIENIDYIDLTDVPISDRRSYIIDRIIK